MELNLCIEHVMEKVEDIRVSGKLYNRWLCPDGRVTQGREGPPPHRKYKPLSSPRLQLENENDDED